MGINFTQPDKPGPRPSMDRKLSTDDTRTLVRTNQVAPIIIKDCREEFQHLSEFKDPIVYGSIADNMPEHPLIRGKYFLVRDTQDKDDRLGTLTTYQVPNFQQAGSLPVYTCGTPTIEGLHYILNELRQKSRAKEDHQSKFDVIIDLFVFVIREEPVLFVKVDKVMVPFSVRHQDNLHDLISGGRTPCEANDLEARIRKETVDMAVMKDENTFFFYHDVEKLTGEPHFHPVRCDDDLPTLDEVLTREVFSHPNMRYQRLCFPIHKAPTDEDVDRFLAVFKEDEYIFDVNNPNPTQLIIGRQGSNRSTVAMAMAAILLCHKAGFDILKDDKKEPHKRPDRNKPDLNNGEFLAVFNLMNCLGDDWSLKFEVDSIVDKCSAIRNMRQAMQTTKSKLENLKSTIKTKGYNKEVQHVLKQCVNALECYQFLIIFHAYLREQFPLRLCMTFSKWLQLRQDITRAWTCLDFSMSRSPPDTVITGVHKLVADDYVGLDVLGSTVDVRTPNFRRLQNLPVYGMAQPSRDGLAKVASQLTQRKPVYKMVVLINLRNDLVLECDGHTFAVHDPSRLGDPITHPMASGKELEEMEDRIKKCVKGKKSVEVYMDLSNGPVLRDMNSVLTPQGLYENQRITTLDLAYVRFPLQYDISPKEQEFDDLHTLLCQYMKTQKDWESNEIAFVFNCRTGKSRTTLAMAAAGLMFYNSRKFPYGAQPEEVERISCPNASYTQGNYLIVQKLVRMLPGGQQIKRETDLVLDKIFETMSPMYFHLREVIFVIYNKMKAASKEEERLALRLQCLDSLERYLYLILYNCFLQHGHDSPSFASWMKTVASRVGVYELLDNLSFLDFEPGPGPYRTMKERWAARCSNLPFVGEFI